VVSYLDIILVLILVWALWRGWMNGFVSELFSFLAFFVGIYAAVYLSETVAKMVGATDGSISTRVAVFLGIFLVVVIGMYFLGKLISKNIKGSGEKWNKALGATFSLAKYLLGTSSLFVMLHALDDKFHMIPQSQKDASIVYEPVNDFSKTVIPAIEDFDKNILEKTS
jgi:membrane protein required for colicin V production